MYAFQRVRNHLLLQISALSLRPCTQHVPGAAAQSSCEILPNLPITNTGSLHPALQLTRSHATNPGEKERWQYLAQQGEKLNPCNSPFHPAAQAGVPLAGTEVMFVQEAYTPKSTCFGCGPAHPDGLHLKSKRIQNGLEATIVIPTKFCAFPGIVNGGIISTLMDCHGNWTAAIALMDKSCLPRPPLTLTASTFLAYKEPTPPNTPLVLRSKVISIKEGHTPGMNRATVEVDVNVYEKMEGGQEKLLVSGTVQCKRLGALREL